MGTSSFVEVGGSAAAVHFGVPSAASLAAAEGVRVSERALAAIARAADGGMRDGQSIFDQMIAFCGGADGEEISEQDVINVFGLASGLELRELAEALFANDLAAAFALVQQLADQGRDLERLYGDLIGFLRNVLVAQLCPADAARVLEVSEGELQDLAAAGDTADAGTVQRVLEGLVQNEALVRASLNKRIYLEVTLAQVMRERDTLSQIFI